MGVDGRLVVRERDVAREREHLDLLVERDLLVLLALPVEVAEDHVAERANGGEVRGGEVLGVGEAFELLHDPVAAVEHERVGAEAVLLVQQLELHPVEVPALPRQKRRPRRRAGRLRGRGRAERGS